MWDSQLISLAYDAALDPKRWADLAEALERCLGGVVVLAIPQPTSHGRGELVAPSLDSHHIDSYCRRYFALDPWAAQAASLAVGTVFEHEPCSAARLVGSPFHRHWLEPQGLAPIPFLGCVVERDARHGDALLSVFRRSGVDTRRVTARRLGAELVSHLRRAVQLHFRRVQLEGEVDALSRTLDHVPVATILVDARGQVRSQNRAAERLLAARDGLALGRDGLHAYRPEDTLRLRHAQAVAAGRGSSVGCGTALLLERGSGRRALRVLVKRLRVSAAADDGSRSLIGLFVSDPEECVAPPGELLRSFYGLTLAESALTRELSNGHSLAEAASRLEITYGTARQRLGQVFAKTRTTRQAELVHLVLTGPESLLAEE